MHFGRIRIPSAHTSYMSANESDSGALRAFFSKRTLEPSKENSPAALIIYLGLSEVVGANGREGYCVELRFLPVHIYR